ncbi:MAG: ribosome maturation factor RimP [Desulfobacteraceae bacterium]|nr:ribosome maturation factor RimP [Desulfobacteraceae bacterium]MCF8095656.1 ribosome maturation factor RimP [Desulfobacteraceae bacterium]
MKKHKKKQSGPKPEERACAPVSREDVISLVWDLADPMCAAEGMELIQVEYQREPGGWILRLFIEKPGGVDIEDCTVISRQIDDLLDIKLDTEFPYTLEVSSPGPERPLSKKSDFNRFAGHSARVRTRSPLGGQKNFKGVLAGIADNDMIQLTLDRETIAIPYEDITKARLANHHGDDIC